MSSPIIASPRLIGEEAYFEPPLEEKTIPELIVEIAIRILFIGASVLTAAAAFPIKFHAVVLPLVGLSATLLAALYPEEPSFPQSDLPPLPPLIYDPIQALPAQAVVPIQRPRGNQNTGNNCPFNTTLHIFESIPQLAEWFRHPLTLETDIDTFLNFIARYNPPEGLIEHFRTFVDQIEQPRHSVIQMFRSFIQGYQHRNQWAVYTLGDTFEKILIVQPVYAEYLAAVDLAVQENRPIANADSVTLRFALSQINPAIPMEPEQVDAAEIMTSIFDLLPPELKLNLENTYHLQNGQTLHPPAENPGFLTLEFKRTFNQMWNYYMDHGDIEPYQGQPVTRGTVRFLAPPPFVCIQIKRFYAERSWLPWSGYHMGKIQNDIPIPEEITIPVGDQNFQYRLVSFANHIGSSIARGHYTAARNINGVRYRMSDERVTPVGQAAWSAQLQQSYLLCYLPVQPG